MIAWFVHGWGFEPSLWDALAAHLPGLDPRLADRGYFGSAGASAPDEPSIWITHSLGTMLALGAIAPTCRAMVAINGFDRFAGGEGFPGVAPRVLDRMAARLDKDPAGTVHDFRMRCGANAPVDSVEREPLARDLDVLRKGDCRAASAVLEIPLLSLQGGTDPILPAPLIAQALHDCPGASHEVHPAAGHLLPLEQPEWCADRIAGFVERLAR